MRERAEGIEIKDKKQKNFKSAFGPPKTGRHDTHKKRLGVRKIPKTSFKEMTFLVINSYEF